MIKKNIFPRFSAFLFLFSFFIAYFPATLSLASETLGLDQAVGLALINNPEIKIAALNTAISDDKLASAKTLRYPAFHLWATESYNISGEDFEVDQGAFGQIPMIGPVPWQDVDYHLDPRWTTHLIFRVVQPVSQLYRIGLEIDILKADANIARLQETGVIEQVTDQVRLLYYGITETSQAHGSVEESLRYYQGLKTIVENEFAKGVVLKSAVLQVETGIAEAQYHVLALSNQLKGHKEEINNLMGRDIGTPFTLAPVSREPELAMSLEQAGKTALLNRPDLKEMALKAGQARTGVKIKKSKYFPDISLMGLHVSSYNTPFVPKKSESVGVMLEWDVFQWGNKHHELNLVKRTLGQADKSLENARDQALIEVNRNYRALSENLALLKAKKLGQALAMENLRVMINKYKQQQALAPDLLKAQSALAQALSQYNQALMSCLSARADFNKSIGGY